MLDFFFKNQVMTTTNYIDFVCRIFVALICGALVGLERERRLKNAGLRTHIIVALASCLMMIVSKYGFMDIVTLTQYKIQADGSRIAQGVIQAIGFLGAGVIYVRRESVVGLTTAAGLWATVGIGVAIGAGMYGLGIFTTFLILLTQWMLHKYHTKSHMQNSGWITCNLTAHGISFIQFDEYMKSIGASLKDISIRTDEKDQKLLKANVQFGPADSMAQLMEMLMASEYLDSVEVFPTL